ncbi:aminotransferase class I/II-fold pyridoxal phosphate-dependent enzyme [Jannaschia sp. Os4]|uniref:aminotransferase class I/II-fold pyridoxal phosphate-dependent enzyme n=1 Tax=Jannaschia sp. Os4 TaxID=2807617 RepID=UPI001939EF18|nr:aminotransferase class I/II-fold pyridoxal phosphate-dependent enzyme [Jannaschia sp. Os4]MBM2577167.1 aminotransferase class I/II-fold pyridoxal phosphate-dependent enzyme [Jannaschia sp. Os4]
MTFHPFAVERFLSEMEHGVRFNFSESGVHPMRYADLLDLAGIDPADLLDARADYPQVEGTTLLRERIAAMYGAAPDEVLVTVGATEANTLAAQTLLGPGDAVVRLVPTYAQLPGVAANLGHAVRDVPLTPGDWRLDAAALDAACGPDTKLIHVVDPNNPTGRILSEGERDAIRAAAARTGAWIVADEVYAGTERTGNADTPSFWGTHDRVVAINSMSKAYGLPGLRLGWVVAPADTIRAMWRRHEYASIAAPDLSMRLAEAALEPTVREALRGRARRLIRRGFDVLRDVLATRPGRFSVAEPDASAMSFVGYDLPIGSEALAARLKARRDVLVIPGALFGVEKRFRFSSALPEDHLREGLARLIAETDEIAAGR